MLMSYEGGFLTPGQTAEILTLEPQLTGIFWGHYDQQVIGYNVVLDGASRDAGNAGFTTTLRPGLLLGRVSSTGKLKQWDPTATDGTQRIAAVLLHSQFVQRVGSNADRFIGYVLFGGNVKVKGLVQASETAAGITGTTYEYTVRSQMSKAFRFDDDALGYSVNNPLLTSPKTTNYTVLTTDAGTHFTAEGAGAINFTLPATPTKDMAFWFTNLVDQNMVITAGTADTIITFNDIAADSVALQTSSQKIGGSFKVIGTGTKWLFIPNVYDGQTVTVVS